MVVEVLTESLGVNVFEQFLTMMNGDACKRHSVPTVETQLLERWGEWHVSLMTTTG